MSKNFRCWHCQKEYDISEVLHNLDNGFWKYHYCSFEHYKASLVKKGLTLKGVYAKIDNSEYNALKTGKTELEVQAEFMSDLKSALLVKGIRDKAAQLLVEKVIQYCEPFNFKGMMTYANDFLEIIRIQCKL